MSERMAYLKGLMSEVPRKNSWQLAEEAGEATPDGMQRLLSTAVWDVEGVRDDLRDYVLATLGSAEGCWCSMKVFFEEGKPFGWGQAAVQRYSRSGRELSDWGFLGYASEKEQALIDRALYLPQEWTADEERRREAKVPADKTFATKPELGRQMLERAFAAGVPAQWVTGDSVYGGDRRLRLWLEEQRRWFVLGIGKDEPLWSGFYQQPADERASVLPKTAWQRLSCGTGAKGPRVYDWVLLPLPRWGQTADVLHALLVRRSLADSELAYFVVFAPAGTPLQTLVSIAGMRWTIEECFEVGKSETGLDEYEVRHWPGWYRHITLSLLAVAFLAVTRCQALQLDGPKKQVLSGG